MPAAMPSAGSEADAPPTGTLRSAVRALPLPSMRLLILVLIVLLAALQYRLWVGPGSRADLHGLHLEIVAQKAELERLRTRNQELQAEVEDLRSGEAALEERARDELGMIKGGEAFIQVIERSPLPAVPAPPDTEPATPAPRHRKSSPAAPKPTAPKKEPPVREERQ